MENFPEHAAVITRYYKMKAGDVVSAEHGLKNAVNLNEPPLPIFSVFQTCMFSKLPVHHK